MAGRTERRTAQRLNGKARTRALPGDAAEHLTALMTATTEANDRYLTAAQNVVRGMGLGAPKEGHQWVVDPPNKRVVERPLPPR